MTRDRLRVAAGASIAGILTGVVVGLVARVAMRFIALMTPETPQFSLAGTAGILSTFGLMACALAMIYAFVSYGYRRRPARIWWALGGLGLLGSAIFLTPLRLEIAKGPPFVALFIPIGLLLGWMAASLGNALWERLPEPVGVDASVGYVVLAIPGLLSLVGLPLLIVFGILQLVGVIPVPAN